MPLISLTLPPYTLKMIQIGTYNNLLIERRTSEGLVLTDGEKEVLLFENEGVSDYETGETLFVFVYNNKEGRLVATTKRPVACVGDFAFLKVVGESEFGAFVDIGIDKDVFVPLREQKYPMKRGNSYVVFLYVDQHNDRLCASGWLGEHAASGVPDVEEGDEVSLLIAERSELGFTAVIDNKYLGLLYHNELYEELEIGEQRQGYIKRIRENNKIDLSLRAVGFDFILESKDALLDYLRRNGGVLELGDKSSPEDIHQQLKMSKKAFKQVIGGLYKQRLITISDYEVRLVNSED